MASSNPCQPMESGPYLHKPLALGDGAGGSPGIVLLSIDAHPPVQVPLLATQLQNHPQFPPFPLPQGIAPPNCSLPRGPTTTPWTAGAWA